MPSLAAISVGVTPSAFNRAISDCLTPNGGRTALVAAFTLGLGDAFTLAFQHRLTLCLPNRANDSHHQATHRCARVERLGAGHGLNPQADLLRFQSGDDGQQVANRSGKPTELGDHQGIAVAHIVERLLKLVALRHRRYLLAENLAAPGSVKLPLLGFQACHLGER